MSRIHTTRVRFACLALFGALPTLPACISSPSPDETGIRIGDQTLSQFKAGVTTEQWLVAVLGKPTTWARVEGVENTKVFRYATAERASGLASLISGHGNRTTSVTYFLITDGIVTRFWADRAKEATLLGGTIDTEPGTKQDNSR